MLIETPGAKPFYDQPGFFQAAQEATRRANRSGRQQRITRDYGSFAVHDAELGSYGVHISFVNPDQWASK